MALQLKPDEFKTQQKWGFNGKWKEKEKSEKVKHCGGEITAAPLKVIAFDLCSVQKQHEAWE